MADDRQRIDDLVNRGLLDQWYAVAKSVQVKPGKPHPVKALGRNLVLWRDAGGALKPEVHSIVQVVADAGVVTAGAAFAHIDLALALVRRVSPGLAEHVARLLVIDERASQSAYLVTDHLSHSYRLVLAFEQQARARLGQALDVGELAAEIGTSRRTLERRTQAALGMSPLVLVQRLRAERAIHLLRTTTQSVDQIAPQVGDANASTLRALLRRVRTGPHVRPDLNGGPRLARS